MIQCYTGGMCLEFIDNSGKTVIVCGINKQALLPDLLTLYASTLHGSTTHVPHTQFSNTQIADLALSRRDIIYFGEHRGGGDPA